MNAKYTNHEEEESALKAGRDTSPDHARSANSTRGGMSSEIYHHVRWKIRSIPQTAE